jgi:hypothetical protein
MSRQLELLAAKPTIINGSPSLNARIDTPMPEEESLHPFPAELGIF